MSNKIDPFDIEWVETDPLDREVFQMKSIIELRKRRNVHSEPPEHLPLEEVREVVSDPDEIHVSAKDDCREVYYKIDESQDYKFARAVVDFSKSPNQGIVISWSRYNNRVSSRGIVYRKERP